MAWASALRRDDHPKQRARIIGTAHDSNGNAIASHEYRLGCAWDGDEMIVRLIEDVPGIGITFEARDFEAAFERAMDIAYDMAELAGHLSDGVLVSLTECENLADLGLDAD